VKPPFSELVDGPHVSLSAAYAEKEQPFEKLRERMF
jgi:hypothetical protein